MGQVHILPDFENPCSAQYCVVAFSKNGVWQSAKPGLSKKQAIAEARRLRKRLKKEGKDGRRRS